MMQYLKCKLNLGKQDTFLSATLFQLKTFRKEDFERDFAVFAWLIIILQVLI